MNYQLLDQLQEALYELTIAYREAMPKIPCVNGKVIGKGSEPTCTYFCAIQNGCQITTEGKQ